MQDCGSLSQGRFLCGSGVLVSSKSKHSQDPKSQDASPLATGCAPAALVRDRRRSSGDWARAASWCLPRRTSLGDLGLAAALLAALAVAVASTSLCRPLWMSLGCCGLVTLPCGWNSACLRRPVLLALDLGVVGVRDARVLCLTSLCLPSLVMRCLTAGCCAAGCSAGACARKGLTSSDALVSGRCAVSCCSEAGLLDSPLLGGKADAWLPVACVAGSVACVARLGL